MNYKIRMCKDDFFKIHSKIHAHNLTFKENDIIFNVDRRSYNIIKKTNYKFVVVDSVLITFINIGKNHYLLIFGVLFLIMILYINTYRVEDIVFSSSTLINNEIEKEIKSNYKRLYCYDFSNEDYKELTKKMQQRYIDYPYLNIYKKNNIVHVDIENVYTINNSNNLLRGDIIAKKDAVVDSIIVYNGKANVVKNTYVKKGDILIIDEENGAKGEVLAYTYNKITITVNKEEKEEIIKENSEEYNQINLFKKDFNLGKDNTYKYSNIKTKTVFNLFDIFCVKKIVEQEKNVIIKTYKTIDEAKEKAMNDYMKSFTNNKVNEKEEIIDMKFYNIKELANSFEVTYIVKAKESIATLI